MDNLNQLLEKLSQKGVDFIIVGGFAALLYGSSQVTKDLDICLSLTPENIQIIRDTLAPLHPKHRMTPQKLSFMDFPEDLEGIQNLYIQTDLGVIDILGQISGVGPFERLNEKARPIELFGKTVKIIALDDLIEAKKWLARPKDLATVLELEVIKGGKG